MTESKKTPAEVITELGQLEPDVIAKTLKVKGITGFRGREYSCPIASHVYQETGEMVWIDHNSWGPVGNQMIALVGYEIPESCGTFAKQFDEGDYPDLVTPA